jgi:hypothetical protein
MGYFSVLFTSAGYTGAPGYTKLKFMASNVASPTTSEVNTAAAAGRAFLAASAVSMPTGVSYSCQSPAQWYSDAGVLLGEIAITSLPSSINGSGGANYPGGVGAVVYWSTGALNGGHRVKGRTYLVPFATAAFSTDGTLVPTAVTAIQNAANTFVTTVPAPAVNTRKLDQADRGDATYAVIAGTLKDRTAFLRTRRT